VLGQIARRVMVAAIEVWLATTRLRGGKINFDAKAA
jgi:hypothetical protein